MKTFFTILITAALAAGGTWLFLNLHSEIPPSASERKPLFYQSAMHPWIKSDKPGKCTICGMALTPIYPGEKSLDATGGEDVIILSSKQTHVLNVQTAEAMVQPLVHTLQVAGMVDDDERRHRILSAYVDGRVDKLYANHHGVEVTAGEPLALVYSPSLLQAEREYRQLSGDLKRNTALRLRQMGLTDEQITALTDKDPTELTSQILAPLTGTVVAHNVYEGQYVTTGQMMFEIADFSVMWFMMDVYEQDLPWIEIGQKVAVTTPSRPGKTYEGKVTFIDPNFNEATRSTQVRVELPNPLVNGRRELLHKLYADGLVQAEIPATLSVPRSAVIETGPQAVVYTDEKGSAYKQVPVKLGRRGDTLIEIISGLKQGDKVVTNGNLLIDGQAELNRSFMAPASTSIADASIVISVTQKRIISDFLKTADSMAAALAADNLDAFNQASEPAMRVTSDLTALLKAWSISPEKLKELDDSRHFHGAETLAAARSNFLKFTMAATDVLTQLRKLPGFPEMHIMECPMVKEAVPEAKGKGRWIQTGGRPHQNPFFGAEMLECGEEIKP